MTQKKPDRWERMVDDCHFNDRSDAADAVTLLRKQHQAVVRMVKEEYERTLNASLTHKDVSIRFGLDCQAAMCKTILTLLKKRAT